MSKLKLIAAHEWFYVERKFKFISDPDRLGRIERWQILQNTEGPFEGDCEDCALTIMNRLIEQDVNKDDLFIVRCATETCPKDMTFNHVILGYKDGDDWWFSDNRRIKNPAAHKTIIKDYKFYDAISIDNLRGIARPKLFL